jgi:hypothetical protein
LIDWSYCAQSGNQLSIIKLLDTRYEAQRMDHLTSRKLTDGVHCLTLGHKRMYVTASPDPDEFAFYDKYDSTAYWCVETQRGFGPDGDPVRPD